MFADVKLIYTDQGTETMYGTGNSAVNVSQQNTEHKGKNIKL